MEIRNPKKGEGVPRETVSNNCIGELTKALQSSTSLGLMNHKVLVCAISKGYFDAPMTKQLDILADVIFEVLNERSDQSYSCVNRIFGREGKCGRCIGDFRSLQR
jgi:hypothetical protein